MSWSSPPTGRPSASTTTWGSPGCRPTIRARSSTSASNLIPGRCRVEFEVSDDGQDAPVVVDAGRELEFAVDPGDVVDDGAFGHAEVFGDGGIGSALRDQGEN